MMCPSNLIEITLKLHKFCFFRLYLIVELGDFDLSLLLIMLILSLHFKGFALGVEKFIVCLTEDPLHFVKLLAHRCIFIFKHSEVAHRLSHWIRQYLLESSWVLEEAHFRLHACEGTSECGNIRFLQIGKRQGKVHLFKFPVQGQY